MNVYARCHARGRGILPTSLFCSFKCTQWRAEGLGCQGPTMFLDAYPGKKNSSNSSHKNSDDLFLVIIFSKFTYISVIFTNHLQKIMTTFFVISSIFLP